MLRDALIPDAPSPPEGSKIRVHADEDGLTLQWPTPRQGSFKTVLTFVFDCVVLRVTAPRRGALAVMMDNWFIFVCVVVWVVGWTLGAAYVSLKLLSRIRGPGPERIVLTDEALRYLPSNAWNWQELRRIVKRAGSEISVPWHQLASLQLDDSDAGQRLLLDRGPKQVDIGEHLSHAEREWLLDVICQQANRRGYR